MKSKLRSNEIEELWYFVFVWQTGVYCAALAGLELIL